MAAEAADAFCVVDLRLAARHRDRLCRAALGAPAAADAVPFPHLRTRGEARLQPVDRLCKRPRQAPAEIELFARGHEEIFDHRRQRVPKQFHAGDAVRAEAAPHRFREHGHPVGAEPDQPRQYEVERVEAVVFRGGGQSHMPTPAAGGAVPLHRVDRVGDGQARLHEHRKVDEHSRELLPVRETVVELGLQKSRHTAEKVLDPAGEGGHAVGLELAAVDHEIRVRDRVDDVEVAAEGPLRDMHVP